MLIMNKINYKDPSLFGHSLFIPINLAHQQLASSFSPLKTDGCFDSLIETVKKVFQFVICAILYLPCLCIAASGMVLKTVHLAARCCSEDDLILKKKVNVPIKEINLDLNNPLFPALRVFISSAPFEIEHSGDYDYGAQIAQIIGNKQVKCEFVTGSTIHKGKPLYNPELLSLDRKDLQRKQAVDNIRNYLLSHEGPKILHLQLRTPETGCLFSPEDLIQLRKDGIKVVITCHEWCLNNHRPNYQEQASTYFSAADHVIFLNQDDVNGAVQKAKIPFSYSLSAVPPTLPIRENFSEASILARKCNILCFGALRRFKGFEQAVELAEKIKERKWNHARVIIAGRPDDPYYFTQEILKKAFKLSTQEATQIGVDWRLKNKNIVWLREKIVQLRAKQKDALPIDFHLDINEKEFTELATQCKYAYKPDNKGFANNASSIINLLACGCITFAKWGIVTGSDFLKGGKFENALILTPEQIALPFFEPSPDFVLAEIERREKEENQSSNRKTMSDSKKAMEEVFHPEVIGKHMLSVYQEVFS